MKIPIRSGHSAPFLVALLLTASIGVLLTGCGHGHETGAQASQEQLYTCGMHPQVIQNKPGNCPICGMKLTPVRKQAGAAASSSGERKIKYYNSSINPGETK